MTNLHHFYTLQKQKNPLVVRLILWNCIKIGDQAYEDNR